MSKYTLTIEHHDQDKVTHEFNVDSLSELLSHLERFMASSGFIFDRAKETLTLVVKDQYEPYSEYDDGKQKKRKDK